MTLEPLAGIGEVGIGDDLAALLAAACPAGLRDEDVLVVAHKVVSKAEGAVVELDGVEPSERALELAAERGKDPRAVEVVLRESVAVLRAERGVLVCETRGGFVCANAGVDASNVPEGYVVTLPADADASARALRERLRQLRGAAPGIVVADSFGRAWRLGQTDVAVGAAGVVVLDDWRGRADGRGRELTATMSAVADAVAAAADLARSKDSNEPAVLVRGLDRFVTREDGPGAAALRRPPEEDLFR